MIDSPLFAPEGDTLLQMDMSLRSLWYFTISVVQSSPHRAKIGQQ
jgi:hypothetical protein